MQTFQRETQMISEVRNQKSDVGSPRSDKFVCFLISDFLSLTSYFFSKIQPQTYFIIAMFIAGFSSCNNPQPQTLSDADWLIGTWQGKTKNNTVFYERWNHEGDTLFNNTNYRIENSDTLIGGKSRISLRNGNIFYTNGMDGKNEMTWRATHYSPTLLIFENGTLPKLQTIKFELTNENKWHATLIGNKDTTEYFLEKVN